MKSLHSFTTKCVDNLIKSKSYLHGSNENGIGSIYHSIKRWNCVGLSSIVPIAPIASYYNLSTKTYAAYENNNNNNNDSIIDDNNDNSNKNTNCTNNNNNNNDNNDHSQNGTQIIETQSNTNNNNSFNKIIKDNCNIKKNYHNININNGNLIKTNAKHRLEYRSLEHVLTTNHKHNKQHYYLQNKRLFNIQSQSASSAAAAANTDSNNNNNSNNTNNVNDNDDGGVSLRDLRNITRHLGEKIGSKIYIWGQVSGTSLGFDESFDSAEPIYLDDTNINDGSGFRDISIGVTQTAIVTGNGDLYMFGGSKYGELGINEDINGGNKLSNISGTHFIQLTPVKVEGISNVVKVSCGTRHTAAITANGELYTWGWGGSRWGFACGGLGHGDKESLNIPKKVNIPFEKDDDPFVIDVSCGDKHTLILTRSGNAYAMGEGEHGRLGTGHTSNAKKPVKLHYFNDLELSHIYAAKEYSFGLSSKDGIPFGWGRNDRNQMGQGGGLAMDIYSCDPTPGPVNLQNVINMDLSSNDVLAVTNDGTVYHWGDRIYLEPNAINSERFQNEIPNGKIINVGASTTAMFFISDEGELFSCNKTLGMRSDVFTLGHGSVQPFKIAKRVEALDGEIVKKISAHDQRTAVIVE